MPRHVFGVLFPLPALAEKLNKRANTQLAESSTLLPINTVGIIMDKYIYVDGTHLFPSRSQPYARVQSILQRPSVCNTHIDTVLKVTDSVVNP